MPTSFEAVLVILLFLIPGFIARGVLSSIYPTSEPSEARLVLTAIALSCINYGVWSWLLVLAWKGAWYERAQPLALLSVLILFLSPVGLTLAVGRSIQTNAFRKVRETFGIRHPTPKSWDYFFGKGLPCWVIATLRSGRVIGGFYGTDSFASSFPAEEDLYLEKLCNMTFDGRLNGITPLTLGGIIRMQDVELLELFEYLPEALDDAE